MVLLVRHGETEWSRDAKHTGRTDVPLTDEGREQARLAGRRLAGRSLALVLTSPLQRATETARLAGLGDRAELEPDLAEWDYGDYEGRTTVEIREERPGWDVWTDGCPNGETVDEVGARADRVIERVLGVDGDVALVAHGHLLRVFGARWMGVAAVRGGALALATSAVCELGWERERRVLEDWNDTSHLRGDG